METSGDEPAEPLFPEEEAGLGRAVEQRRREFAVGRTCARRALALLGVPAVPLLPGPHREPRWPNGMVGSITHCAGYCAAAVARRRDVAALGIDAEPAERLPEDVLDLVTLESERAWLEANPGAPWDRLLFSAKESVFKAWFPLTGRWLGFEEAEVTFDVAAGAFVARLLVPGPVVGGTHLQVFDGRYAHRGDLLLTSVVVLAGAGDDPAPGLAQA